MVSRYFVMDIGGLSSLLLVHLYLRGNLYPFFELLENISQLS